MIIIKGRPATKKNNPRIVTCGRHHKLLPSKAYEEYELSALWQLKTCRERYAGPVSVKALYWMPDRRSWPDWSGLTQATGDILQKAGIIANDRDIMHWDGTRIMGVDKDNPRVEIEISQVMQCWGS